MKECHCKKITYKKRAEKGIRKDGAGARGIQAGEGKKHVLEQKATFKYIYSFEPINLVTFGSQ